VNREQAGAWLAAVLGDRPLAAAAVAELAARAGISKRTLHRAKADIGATSEKRASGWVWALQAEDRDAGQDRGKVASANDRPPEPLTLRLLSTHKSGNLARAGGVRVTVTYTPERGWVEEPNG